MQRLKIAVIGAGRLGGFHAQKLTQLPQAELVAVVDPVAAQRDRVAAECHVPALPDHRSLLGRIDAAVIATPTRYHHAVALDLLSAGVHLLVEKPITTTRAEADELVAAAARQGVVLQVGHVERFNPAFTATLPHVRRPKYIEAVRSSGYTFRSIDVGVVLDLMIHDLDLVLALVGSPVRRVEALGASVVGGHEDVANARLHFACGCVATLSASRVSYEPVRRMQVWSERAFAAIDFATRTTTLVRPSQQLLRREFDATRLSPEEVEQYRTRLAPEHLPQERLEFAAVDALTLELQDFLESVETPRAPLVTGAAGRDAVALAQEILAQIRVHGWDGDAGAAGGHAIPAPHFDYARSRSSNSSSAKSIATELKSTQ